MKPLSEPTKAWAYRYVVNGPLRAVAAPLWHAALDAELAWFRLRRGPPDPAPLDDLTAIIKTFERPSRCQSLVASIRALHPRLRIIVVDDSRTATDFGDVDYVRLPFDSGVSAGRQAALDRVETPYLVSLDDDHLFYHRTRLSAALELLRSEPEIDILGGQTIDLPLFIVHDFRTAWLPPVAAAPKTPLGTRFGPAEVMDKLPSFYVARTAATRKVGWDPALKRLDHADFFARARGILTSALWEDFSVLHRRDPFDRHYGGYRFDEAADQQLLRARYFGVPAMQPPARRNSQPHNRRMT